MHFPLVDQTPFALVNKFDGVFNGQNMVVAVVVDVVDHGRKGRRLTGARGASNEHKPARQHRDIPKHLAHAQVVHGQHLRRNGSENRSSTPILIKSIDSKTRDTRHFKGEVRLEELLKVLALAVVHDVVDERLHLGVVLSGDVDPTHIAVNPNHGGQPCRQMQIRSALLDAEGE